MGRVMFLCKCCGNVMDEVEATTAHREVHTELDGSPSEWIYELRCIYCGADGIDLEEI